MQKPLQNSNISGTLLKVRIPLRVVLKKKEINYHRIQLFIKYQYMYMFRPPDVFIRLALERFKRNIPTVLLEMRSHFLHNVFTISGFLFNTFLHFNVAKNKKMSCIKLLKFWGGRRQRGLISVMHAINTFFNVLKLACWWPREVDICSNIHIFFKSCCVRRSFVYFLLYFRNSTDYQLTHTKPHNLLLPNLHIFVFNFLEHLFSNTCGSCLFLKVAS